MRSADGTGAPGQPLTIWLVALVGSVLPTRAEREHVVADGVEQFLASLVGDVERSDAAMRANARRTRPCGAGAANPRAHRARGRQPGA